MSLVAKDDEVHFYKYHLKELIFLFQDGTTKEMDTNRLNSVMLMEDYLENLYPVFKIDLALEKSVYQKIIAEKDTLKVKIYMQKYYRINDKKEESIYYKYINSTFALILDDDDEDMAKDVHEKEFPQGDEDNIGAITIGLEMFLFKKSTIKANKVIVNRIFRNCTPMNALAFLLIKLGVKNVLIDKVDNKTKYYQLIIPPLNINEGIHWLDSYYGFHKHGTIIFFGLLRSYILRFHSKTKAFEAKEIQDVCFLLPKEGSKISDSYAMLEKKNDPNKYYVIVEPSQFYPRTSDRSESVIRAEDIEIVSTESGETTQKTDKTQNKKIIVAKGINPYYATMYRNVINSAESEITIYVKDVDLNVFEPNKHYYFLFEDTALAKKYKGKYFLCYKEAILVKEGKDFTTEVKLVLRKFT